MSKNDKNASSMQHSKQRSSNDDLIDVKAVLAFSRGAPGGTGHSLPHTLRLLLIGPIPRGKGPY